MAKSKGVPVSLAGRDFVVRRIPMARIKRLGSVISGVIKDVSTLDLEKNDEAVQIVIDKLLEFPHEILSLFINDLPKEIFEDEEDGVTFPEFMDALTTAVEENKLDMLKNFLTPLVGAISNQGSR